MNRSDSINELAQSFVKFRQEMKSVPKNKKGHHGSYADIEHIIEATTPILSKYSLSVMQLICSSTEGKASLETVLMHASGQYIGATMDVNIEKGAGRTGPQDMGLAISYARRYAMVSILCLSQTDNDGQISEEEDDFGSLNYELDKWIKGRGIESERVKKWCDSAGVKTVKELSDELKEKYIKLLKENANGSA